MREQQALIAMCFVLAFGTVVPTVRAQGRTNVSEQAKAEAGTHFTRGAELFQEGLFRAALVELKRAYEIAPNYRVLYNVGQAHVALGEFVEGVQAYEEFLAQGGSALESTRRAELQSQLVQLRRHTALLEIKVSREGATIAVDGTDIGKSPLRARVPLNVGQHRISARAEDGATASEEVDLAGGDLAEVTLALVAPVATRLESAPLPPPEPALAQRTKWSIGLLASAGALGISGGVLALSAKWARDDHDQALRAAPGDPEEQQVSADHLRRRALAADLLFAGALTVGVTGGVLLFTKGRDHKEHAQKKGVQVRVGWTPRMLVAEGRF